MANARFEDECFADYMARTDVLYGDATEENAKIVKEALHKEKRLPMQALFLFLSSER